jgi:hypothetical protein
VSVLETLPAIGLEELAARAELLTRVDRKYVLAAADLPALLGRLPAGARVLQVGGRRRFGYRSDYLDTPGLDAYLGAARRRRRRFKVRIRTYLDSGDRFAEVKTRGPRGVTVKHRIPYAGAADRLDPSARRHTDAVLGGAGVRCDSAALGPALTTTYERSTLYLPGSGTRLTIDAGLRWALPDGTALELPDRVVVETKAPLAAAEADRLLWRLGHRPCSMSKYGAGLAALRPELPANRWRPVLHRHVLAHLNVLEYR